MSHEEGRSDDEIPLRIIGDHLEENGEPGEAALVRALEYLKREGFDSFGAALNHLKAGLAKNRQFEFAGALSKNDLEWKAEIEQRHRRPFARIPGYSNWPGITFGNLSSLIQGHSADFIIIDDPGEPFTSGLEAGIRNAEASGSEAREAMAALHAARTDALKAEFLRREGIPGQRGGPEEIRRLVRTGQLTDREGSIRLALSLALCDGSHGAGPGELSVSDVAVIRALCDEEGKSDAAKPPAT